MRLTDISIRNLDAPEKGAIVFPDDVLSGFGVRVSEGGTKSFVLTHGPRRTRETIGRVGVVSLAEARAEAKHRLAKYTLGKDKPKTISWNAAKDEYLAERKPKLRPRTYQSYTYFLDRIFRYGTTKLTDITPHNLADSLARLDHGPVSQRYAFGTIRAFMRWAHRKHYLDRNPMERMQSPHPYVARERVLSDDELARVWNAASDDTFGKIVKLLILTGQRRGEISQLKAGMIGTDTITLPAALCKNRRSHTFPLGSLARTFLDPDLSPDEYFFKGRGKETPFDGWSKCKPKLEQRAGAEGWTLHDLRRTFASGLAALGVSIPVIERLLNHISGSFGGIVGVYQRYDYLPEMREAIAKWEAFVSGFDKDARAAVLTSAHSQRSSITFMRSSRQIA
jgi:integrase